jgi:hypothetical protein
LPTIRLAYMLNASRSKSVLLLTVVAALAGCERKGVEPAKISLDPRMAKAFAETEPQFCTFQMLYPDASATSADGQVKARYVVVGKSKADRVAAFTETCAESAAAPKAVCEKFLSSDKYPCVASSMFAPSADTTGAWTCSIAFTANDIEETLKKEAPSSAAAIQAAFTACAGLTDDATATPSTNEEVGTAPDNQSPEEAPQPSSMDALSASLSPNPSPSVSPSPSPSPSVSPTPAPPPTVYLKASKRRDACAAAMIAEKMTCVNSDAASSPLT